MLRERPQILTVYGADWCPDCRRIKALLRDQEVPYQWVDTDASPEAEEYIRTLQYGRGKIPTLVFPDGTVLVEPRNAVVEAVLNLPASWSEDEDTAEACPIGHGGRGNGCALPVRENRQEVALK